MNRMGQRALTGVMLATLLAVSAAVYAGNGQAAQHAHNAVQPFSIGYIGWADDPRYNAAQTEQHFQNQPWGRPVAGARVALDDAKFIGISVGTEFSLDEQLVDNTQQVIAAIDRMLAQGSHFVLLDLPAGTIAHVAEHFAGKPVTFFNVTAEDDRLRGYYCQTNLLSTIPSDAQRNDALAQYLVSRQWTKVLLLVGPLPADTVLAKSFARSAQRYGLNVVDTRRFVLSDDPRQRAQNNPKLLTSGANYDVVYIADSDGEFSRAANYAIQHPRPVVGSAGLVAQAWSWSFRQYGARQLNHRIQAQAQRPATGYDWAAWAAVKAVTSAVQRTHNGSYEQVKDYLTSDQLALDSVKGYQMSFRKWDGQLRQPILLTSANWVIGVAPIAGFEHPVNYLDTLGLDPRASRCKLAGEHK